MDGEKINLAVGSQTIVELDEQGMHAKGKQSEVHVTDGVQIESKGDITLDSRGKVRVQGSGDVSLKSSSGNVKLSGSKIQMS